MDIIEFEMTPDEFVHKYYYTKSLESGSGFRFDILLSVKPMFIDDLIERIGKHSIVKRAIDCIDLPDKRTTVRYISGMVNDKYKELKKEYCVHLNMKKQWFH